MIYAHFSVSTYLLFREHGICIHCEMKSFSQISIGILKWCPICPLLILTGTLYIVRGISIMNCWNVRSEFVVMLRLVALYFVIKRWTFVVLGKYDFSKIEKQRKSRQESKLVQIYWKIKNNLKLSEKIDKSLNLSKNFKNF